MGASDACQRDRRWTVIATYSPTTPPAVDAVATGWCLMIPLVMPDSREPVPTSSGSAITRRGGPRNVAATRAAGEKGCPVQAFEDADAAPRAPHCARIITSHQKDEAAPPYAHGDSPRPHCKSAPSFALMRPESRLAGGRGSPSHLPGRGGKSETVCPKSLATLRIEGCVWSRRARGEGSGGEAKNALISRTGLKLSSKAIWRKVKVSLLRFIYITCPKREARS